MTVELAHDVQGQGPLLVLVHGITENRHTWDPLVGELARDHRVLRVDLRGHGESPMADSYGVADLAGDIAPLVDEPPLVVGHSLGGMVASAYGAMFENRGIINVDQSLDLAPLQAGLLQQAELLRGEAFPMVMSALFESLRGVVPDPEWERLTALRRFDQQVVLGVWSVMLDSTPADLDATVTGIVGGVRGPYLSLHGIAPGPDYPSWLTSRMPQATVEVWSDLGHYPHLVRSAEFLDRVSSFEAGLAGA
jgi:pimeloyl-ACP methyl ester carboxylesterase